ncbi:hypothetical protein [Sphingomonas abietis]|uniref:Peptidase M61 catalytic domain-containing protein n=1 Tax=Sphingomonas abietis TaxID=3012344 RepID=A0ABY7NRY3_9SPHN|nr:hypothetical protein [Sphingomonas abietis]WBO24309.1 hypothetical protein PBT88_09520 [Sphingomonas abietis]
MPNKHHRSLWLTIGGIAGCFLTTSATTQPLFTQQAKAAGEAITEYRVLCHRDGGRLWGKSLCGPIMLVDRETRAIYADRNTIGHDLRPSGAMFIGTLPQDIGMANTAIDWAGTRWTMVLLPLPSDRDKRDTLLMHEAFHRIQPDRLPPPVASLPDHLDTLDGRLLLRLEWRALAQALRTDGVPQRTAIRDALAFRALRRSMATEATGRENALEINEGIAEYTGKRLGAGKDAVASTIGALADYDRHDGYVRSFAYASGPAYGLLLDRLSPGWRNGLRPDSDLGALLHHAIGDVALPPVEAVRDRYGFAGIRSEEAAKADAHARQAAHWRTMLIDGPVMRLPLIDIQIQFNPQNVFALPPSGTVYPTATIRDAWGTLTVEQGVLIAKDWKSASVAGPGTARGSEYVGAGWSLKLSPGWIVSNGSVQHQ